MKTYPVILWLPLLLALMTSCQEPLPLTPTPAQPADIICSEDKLPLGGDEYIYRQSLCAGTDSHQGSLYAWKLHTLSGEPPSGSQLDPVGWLLREDGQSIWTSEKELNLDYRSQNGKLTDLITSAKLQNQSPGWPDHGVPLSLQDPAHRIQPHLCHLSKRRHHLHRALFQPGRERGGYLCGRPDCRSLYVSPQYHQFQPRRYIPRRVV